MKIKATTPLVNHGSKYPYYAVSLSMSPLWKPGLGCSVAIRLTPFMEKQDGSFDTLPQEKKAISLLDIFETADGDEHFEAAITKIMEALQELVDNKEL
jgi:hypothetical protein